MYQCVRQEFGEDISFRSGAILVNVVPPLTDVLASLYDSESKLQIFLIIIDIHCPENISALVWLWSVEKPKTGSQMQVLENV